MPSRAFDSAAAAVVAAIAEPSAAGRTDAACAILPLDNSASIPRRELNGQIARASAACASMRPGDRAGVVVFGGDASLEMLPPPSAWHFRPPCARGRRRHRHPEDPLAGHGRLPRWVPPQARRPPRWQRDGRPSGGFRLERLRRARPGGRPPLGLWLSSRYRVGKLRAPATAGKGGTIEVKAHVSAKASGAARLLLCKDGAPVAGRDASLVPGDDCTSRLLKAERRAGGSTHGPSLPGAH